MDLIHTLAFAMHMQSMFGVQVCVLLSTCAILLAWLRSVGNACWCRMSLSCVALAASSLAFFLHGCVFSSVPFFDSLLPAFCTCRKQSLTARDVWLHATFIRLGGITANVIDGMAQVPALGGRPQVSSASLHISQGMGRRGIYWLGFWSSVLYW